MNFSVFVLSFYLIFNLSFQNNKVFLPIKVSDRHSLSEIKLTEIGDFGIIRKARPHIPAHYHTGIDIKRPDNNYYNEPVYSIADGIVISKRTDGPYSEIIIAHKFKDLEFWSLYQHIVNIKVNVGEDISADKQIACFMNKKELDKYGWQFDHLHLEIIKEKPMRTKPTKDYPQRFYNAFSLICYSKNDLNKYYYNPIKFFEKYL